MLWTRAELTAALVLPLGMGLTILSAPSADMPTSPAPTPVAAVSFSEDVAPILEKYCVSCHGGMFEGEERTELALDLTTYESLMAGSEYGTVVEPGDAAESLLIVMIEDGDMPEEGDPVPAEDLETLKTWVAEGAENN